jgi:CIC family chloride channel protein
VGTAAHHLFPLATATPGAYALVGMGAVFAGVVRTPMTSVLIIFEMTQDYAVIVPLMIANLVSLFVASLLQHEPIYEALAVQDGIHLPSARTRHRLDQHTVSGIMKEPAFLLEAEITVREALGRIRASGLRTALVTDQRGVIGIITQSQMEIEADEDSGRILDDLMVGPLFPHMHADQGLDLALDRMGSNQIDLLPVVSRVNVHQLVGIVTLQDVLDAYGFSHS